MPLPKAPKGEKPAITIQCQRRQIILMENVIYGLRTDLTDAGQKLIDKIFETEQLNKELFEVKEAAEKQREAFHLERQQIISDRNRLAFLEGFYEGTNRCSTLVVPNE